MAALAASVVVLFGSIAGLITALVLLDGPASLFGGGVMILIVIFSFHKFEQALDWWTEVQVARK